MTHCNDPRQVLGFPEPQTEEKPTEKQLGMHCSGCQETLIDIEASPEALLEFIDDHRECNSVHLVKEKPEGSRELIPLATLPIGGPDNIVWELSKLQRDCDNCKDTFEVARYRGKTQSYVVLPFGVAFDFPIHGAAGNEIVNMCRACLQALLKRAEED